jgi:hypothetical protein
MPKRSDEQMASDEMILIETLQRAGCAERTPVEVLANEASYTEPAAAVS